MPVDEDVSGLTPEQWEHRLERAASDPEKLRREIQALEREMLREKSWLHENPVSEGVIGLVLGFLGGRGDDYRALGKQIEQELYAERSLKERYRGWLPGETPLDRIFPYIKNFPGRVEPCKEGVVFDGFLKFRGVSWGGAENRAVAVYLNERFPGREPANFLLWFVHASGHLVIKRVFRKELPPRCGSTSSARRIVLELADLIVPGRDEIAALEVDNAANRATRAALMRHDAGKDPPYVLVEDTKPEQTPLGRMMMKLAAELGRKPLDFRLALDRYGVLKITLPLG
ncbi:MAG: hypothetical protein D6806_07745 [Deltaproteobacteria bacterium]|nr:MAG: hypothetical protein D6806_07745 [Deltaproteobacteria bacterium]